MITIKVTPVVNIAIVLSEALCTDSPQLCAFTHSCDNNFWNSLCNSSFGVYKYIVSLLNTIDIILAYIISINIYNIQTIIQSRFKQNIYPVSSK